MEFTIVFWNIWLNSQREGQESPHAKRLLKKLDQIIDTYTPDFIGLNEVLQDTKKRLFVLGHLQSRGYTFQHFAYSSPLDDTWGIGAAFVSKLPVSNTQEISMGDDKFANWRGYPGHSVKAIGTTIHLSAKKSLNVMVAHPLALKPVALREHWRNQRALRQVVAEPRYKQLILGGDFNEFNLMPMSFASREADRFHHRSGTLKNPTWSHNGGMSKWMRCNLDKIFWTKETSTELLQFKVLDSTPSDHAPLLARFKVS